MPRDAPFASPSPLIALARFLLPLLALWLAITTGGRLLLAAWQHARLADLSPSMQALAFAHGLRMDLMLAAFLLLPLALWLTLAPARAWAAQAARAYGLAVSALLVFIEIATFPFFAQYDVRPNLLMVQYLDYPLDVAAMLWQDQRMNLLLTTTVLVIAAFAFVRLRLLRARARAVFAHPWARRALWLLPLAALLFMGARSSLGHRPANLSDALYSPNRVANEIAKNSLYSVAYETYRARKDGKRKAPSYGAMPMAEAYQRVQRLLGITAPDAELPLLRTLPTARPLAAPTARPRNLVILLQESMGAQFVGHLGHADGVTPRLDALSRESLTFTQTHSNGTRSIQGLAGVSAGFLAGIGEGVLKRPKAQQGFFTLASLLKPLGYHASFIYGGEARFDDMKVWYLGNGFDEVIEQKDYASPSFVGTWGVSDEDLMRKAHERFVAHHAAGKPFVSVVFSSSNHTPFELPEGKIAWEPGVPKYSVRNAIKYADHAIGVFFDLARAAPYYRDTVFVVIADHNVRVYGDDEVPVPAFRIPALIHGAGIEARRVDRVMSQPDVLATALTQLGVPLTVPILGTPLEQSGRRDWVLMQFNETFGLLRDGKVAVLRPGRPVRTALYEGGRLLPAPVDTELQRDALALLHATEDQYERRLFRSPDRAAALAVSGATRRAP